MLINTTGPFESRIAVVNEAGKLEEFYLERASRETLLGNIYQGKVVNIQPNLQASFVNIGLEKKGFLHISNIMTPPGKVRDIKRVLRIGQEILVQVIRDEIGEKGPSLTTDISLPGRYLVLRPKGSGISVSKRIVERAEKQRVKKLLMDLRPSKSFGFIIRTAGARVSHRELKEDLESLYALWEKVSRRAANSASPPTLIYQESDLVIRTIRDVFSPEIREVLIDSFPTYQRVKEFFQSLMPRFQNRLRWYQLEESLFRRFKIESEIEQIYQHEIPLPSGGSIVIEPTEALVTIDVNSGRFRKQISPEEVALRTNLEAAQEIARQLRLRDLGGVIVIDFIDMHQNRHKRRIETTLSKELKKDRSKTSILKTSSLGLVELAREKLGPGAMYVPYNICDRCQGTGFLKSAETIGLEVIRRITRTIRHRNSYGLEINVNDKVGEFLESVSINRFIKEVIEKNNNHVIIKKHANFNLEKIEINEHRTP